MVWSAAQSTGSTVLCKSLGKERVRNEDLPADSRGVGSQSKAVNVTARLTNATLFEADIQFSKYELCRLSLF